MRTVGIRDLKDHLSEYVRRARSGERLLITSHGEVVAELRSPLPDRIEDLPSGLQELVQRGLAREIVRNDPSVYRAVRTVKVNSTSRDLLDWEREDR